MIIVQGVFRSGTTLLFRILRQAPQLCCFYEPLHPNLLDHVGEALSDTPSHEKSGLYAEYARLSDELASVFDDRDRRARTVLPGQHGECEQLRAYLDLLADASSSRTVLQFNRAFWMSRWLNHQFRESCFVHVVRDPRSVIWSQFTTKHCKRVRMDWPVLGRRFFKFSSGNLTNVFSPYAYHGAYEIRDYLSLGREHLKQGTSPVVRRAYELLSSTEEAYPYVQALALWAAQVWICHHHAREAFGDRYLLVRYEDLVQDPIPVLESLFGRAELALPTPSARFAREAIRPQRAERWAHVPGAKSMFRAGVHKASIEDVLHLLGYD
jgi:hypothetical protein